MRLLLCLALLSLSTVAASRAADPVAELAAFSAFPQVDTAALLKDVKTARGPGMSNGRDLSVQSVYVVPGAPAHALAALRSWDPTAHRELKVSLHSDLPASPGPGDFGKLSAAASSSAGRELSDKTAKSSTDLQLSHEEAKKLPASGPAAFAAFWSGVLSGRAQAFAGGGAARQPAYDFSSGGGKPGEALAGLVRQQGKIKGQFSSFLSESGVNGGKPSLKPEMYYELIDVEDEGVLTLGAFSSRAAGAGFQAADVLYYASGGYDVALTLYQMWPIDVGGQAATLVWRGDLISAASLGNLHGVEKLASESALMKDISRTVRIFKSDTAR